MNILFIHQNFPGQFRHLAPALAAAGHRVVALAMHERPLGAQAPGVEVRRVKVTRTPGRDTHRLLRDAEAKVLRGEAAAQAMLALARQGFTPDLVVAHPGWGEALYVKDVFAHARLVCLMEFFYTAEGADLGFDPEFTPLTLDARIHTRLRNVALSEALLAMDSGVAPTRWQASRLPPEFAHKVRVIFDGIDTRALAPDPQAAFTQPGTTSTWRHGEPVITFVARNLEPYRGYHVFMRALPHILDRHASAQVLIVGGDGVSYGSPAPAATTWKQIFLDEVKDRLDASRVHFLGQLPYRQYLQLLRVSAAHVYLTYPFVLSWSCLEAMALSGHVVASRTPPVQDFIDDGVNGTLFDFFDTAALADAVIAALAASATQSDAALRAAARQTVVQRCDLHHLCLPQWRALLSEVCGQPV